MSGGIITKLKKHETVLLNGEKVHCNKAVMCGDVLLITICDEANNIKGENIPLHILYEDEDLIVINKPYAMPSHPDKKHKTGTLANALLGYLGKGFTPRIITRLDKDTTGVTLVAKNHLSAQKLTESMKLGQVKKKYVAITVGAPNPKEGVINAPIGKGEGLKRIVTPLGKSAVTKYKVKKVLGDKCLIELWPITGRTHQIRLHLSHIGTPIYGDSLYGEEVKGERVRLHCESLTFNHPISGEEITVSAPLWSDMEE